MRTQIAGATAMIPASQATRSSSNVRNIETVQVAVQAIDETAMAWCARVAGLPLRC